jgi:hypothetical protein
MVEYITNVLIVIIFADLQRKLTIPMLRWQSIMNAFIVIMHADLQM